MGARPARGRKPAHPYGGNRDICITVGNGSGTDFRSALRMATGSPILAHAVADDTLEMAMVNPSALLTQAYRGVGLFPKPLPLPVVAVYPTWDWFAFVLNLRSGIKSLHDVKKQRYRLHVSVKEDVTHSSRVFTDQFLAFYGLSLAELQSWGGRLDLTGAPNDRRRMEALARGELDAIFDEGLPNWFDEALRLGTVAHEIEPEAFDYLASLGWKKDIVPASEFTHLGKDYAAISYSGWPLYARVDLPDQLVHDVCAAFVARQSEIPWEAKGYKGDILQIGRDTFSTPIDVPLHRGAERFYRKYEASRR